MKVLLLATRFHDGNPRRGVAMPAVGLARGLRQCDLIVEWIDPFGSQNGDASQQVFDACFAQPPDAVLVVGVQPPTWSGWSDLAARIGRHGIPLACVDVEDPVPLALADLVFGAQRSDEPRQRFLPPAVDCELFTPRSMERDLAFVFVGRIGRLRRQALSLLRSLPSYCADSNQPLEARVPQRALARLLQRSVVGLDLPGKRNDVVHARVFEALACGAHALAPWSEALCACLEPGKEVFVYRDTGEMVDQLQRLLVATAESNAVLEAGRRRVLAEHGFANRARTLIDALQSRCIPTRVPATTVAEPKVCIYMPVHGAERWVGAAIDSLLAQTHQNLHILAVNDGSRDRSGEVLRAKAACDARVQVLDFDLNRGEAVRRNDALAQLPEDSVFVTNHDADDLSDCNRIAAQVAFLQENPGVHCVGAQARIIDSSGALRDYLRVPTNSGEIDATFHRQNSVIHTAALFRRSALTRAIGYRNSFRSVDDYEFLARFLECGYRIANLPDVLVSRREHGDSISKIYGERQEILRQRIARRLHASLRWRLAQRRSRCRLKVELHGSRRGMEGQMLVQGAGDGEVQIVDDFRYLRLPEASCVDLMLTDCLEQLPRAAGMRCLIEWHGWLEVDGRLRLRTPDLAAALQAAAAGVLRAAELLRHLFGDQVASAVAHRDAYDSDRLIELLPRLGFQIEDMQSIQEQGLPFLVVVARKRKIDAEQQAFAALDLLEDFLLDASEAQLREAWHRQLIGEPSMGSTGEGLGSSECVY